MKQLPIGRQNFEGIIEEGLLYVDKTRQVDDLIRKGQLYFLARPRRFGKTLLVSLLAHLFMGKKHLFEDLYIGRETDYGFEAYPVLQFNFAKLGHKKENLEAKLTDELNDFSIQFDVQLTKKDMPDKLGELVEKLVQKTGKEVVILIDEYDKPMLDFITDIEKAEKNRDVLRDFFSPLKEFEAKGLMRFLFITGVSKFSKVNLFSDLNNLTDLSVDIEESNDLLGITEVELIHYFDDYLDMMAQQFQVSKDILLAKIKDWYGGYSYDGKVFLYNPNSISNLFFFKNFRNYWFASGTPTFLVKWIHDSGFEPTDIGKIEVDGRFFQQFKLDNIDVYKLLFQSGYLTIKKRQTDEYLKYIYLLDYPNYEVQESFMECLVSADTVESNFF